MISGRKAARELIAFYLDAGVDALLRDEPVNRMADDLAPSFKVATGPERKVQARPPSAPLPAKSATPAKTALPAPPPPETAVMAAREAARNAQTLDDLQALLAKFAGGGLRAT